MQFSKKSFSRFYHTSHLFFERCAAHCGSCKIAIFTHRIYFSTGFVAFIFLAFIFTYTVPIASVCGIGLVQYRILSKIGK